MRIEDGEIVLLDGRYTLVIREYEYIKGSDYLLIDLNAQIVDSNHEAVDLFYQSKEEKS